MSAQITSPLSEHELWEHEPSCGHQDWNEDGARGPCTCALDEPQFRAKYPDLFQHCDAAQTQLAMLNEIQRLRHLLQLQGTEAALQKAADYRQGWEACAAAWADHMKRMNDALSKPLPEGWANHAHHIRKNVREALDAAQAVLNNGGGPA